MNQSKETGPKRHLRNSAWKTIDLEHLTLRSYVRLCMLMALCLGIMVSVTFFIADVAGVDTSIHWGSINIADTETGIVVLFVGPFVFAVAGLFGSLLSYRLFIWALRRFPGLTLTGNWKDIVPPEVSHDIQHKQLRLWD